jgi:hypothetical protein
MVALPVTDRAPGDWLTVSLPRPAEACYELFCDIERVPEWLPILASAIVTERDPKGRARRVAFQASLQRATIGYSLTYRYVAEELRVTWSTSPRATTVVRGLASFQEVAPRACLMTYGLDFRPGRGLPPLAHATHEHHPSSATLADFREFAIRTL